MATGSPRGGIRRRDVAHLLGFALAYAAAMTLALAFTIGDVSLSFVWPACGVSALWLFFARTLRLLVVDAVVLGLATAVFNVATGVEAGLSLWFGVVNVAQAVLGAWLLRRLAPELWGCRGRESFTRVGTIFVALVAAVTSSAAAAFASAPALALSGADVSAESILLQVSRNTYGFFAVVTVVHLLLWTLRFGRDEPVHELVSTPGRVEAAALLVVTVAAYLAVYFGPRLPVAWVPLAVTIWAGLRFSPLTVAVQSTVGAALAFTATLSGHGPLTMAEGAPVRAWLLQGVLTVTLFGGLALAASRVQLVQLLHRVDAERRATQDTNDLVATTLGALRAGLLVVSTEGEVEMANVPARTVLERPLLGTTVMDLGQEPRWEELWRALLSTPGVVEFDATVADGVNRQVLHVHAVPLERAGGLVVHLADVTVQQNSRDELVGFAAHAAHDLRGPLMSVRGWLDVMRKRLDQGALDVAEGRVYLSRASDTAARMSLLIDDLVDHAAGEDERLSVEEVDLGEVVTSAAEQAGALHAVTVGDLPVVRGDRTMLSRVVLNLVGNSVKYADPARPLTVEVTSRELPSGETETRFRDNGIGIPEDELQRVFEPFHRATAQGAGNGMGLAMCQQIISRHGGTITAENNGDDPGTTLVVTLPVLDAGAAARAEDQETLRELGLLARPS